MQMIESTDALKEAVHTLSTEDFVTVDTEFVRDKTYWPKLCLVQLAGTENAYIVDPLAEGMDLTPLFRLMQNPAVLKVFHAARQDIEIFVNLTGDVPKPLFDTQVAAMVCGFGDQVGYETLARKLAGAQLDKTSRFTDWTRRPLTKKQLTYAIGDVTHLRIIFEKMRDQLADSDRLDWVGEEMEILTTVDTYINNPDEAWRRVKTRSVNPRFLAILKHLAAWRERAAQDRDIPKNRILKDDALTEIAAHSPKSVQELEALRGVPQGLARGRFGPDIVKAVEAGLAMSEDDAPKLERPEPLPNGIGPLVELLKVMLKLKAEEHDVAPRLIANVADLERIAANDHADVAALHGWRRKVFGEHALALKHGRLGLTVEGNAIKVMEL